MPRKKALAKRKSVASKKRSARPIHKRVLLHPFSVFILLCAGVFLVLWTYHASAVDIKITARVAGLPPSVPAVITYPHEGDHFNARPLTVTGTCYTPGYVKVFNNNNFKGSVVCDNSNQFSLNIILAIGPNRLTVHGYNFADLEGPLSGPVNVFLGASSSQGNTESPNKSYESPPNGAPFDITTEFSVRAFYAGDEVEWPISISGGKAPYAVNVDWGDGTNTVYSRSESGNFDISHRYTSTGPNQGSFTVKINGSDADDSKSLTQFFIFITSKDQLVSNSGSGGSGSLFSAGGGSIVSTILDNKFLTAAWPSFGIVSLMVISFWLGEKEGLWIIRRGPRIR